MNKQDMTPWQLYAMKRFHNLEEKASSEKVTMVIVNQYFHLTYN